jgi:hypothetical protein
MEDVQQADVYIDGEPIRVKAYQRSTTDDMVTRFGSSQQGQSNLDLLKAATQKSFRGGMFQQNFDDPEMAAFIRNGHFNPLDQRLYFTHEMTKAISSGNWADYGVTAWTLHAGRLFFASRSSYTGSTTAMTNRLHMTVLSTGVTTTFTLPAVIQNAGCPITSLVGKDDRIWIAGKTNSPTAEFVVHRLDYATTAGSFGALAGTTTLRKLCWFRDKLYGVGIGSLVLINNPRSGTASYTSIKAVGANPSTMEDVQDMLEYNGALYITKVDGLYRYDGVDVNAVFNYQLNASPDNFKYSAIFNGRMYFTIGNRLFRFDGANLEMIQDFSDAYVIMGLEGGADRLWITARYNETSAAVYIGGNFPDPINLLVYKYALITWNDVGFFEYANEIYQGDLNNKTQAYGNIVNPCAMPVNGQIYWVFPNNYYNGSLEGRSSGFYMKSATLADDYNHTKVPVGRILELYGSTIDAGFPAVPKSLNGVMIDYDSDDSLKLVITEYIRYTYQGVRSDWVEVWNNKNVTADGITNNFMLHDESTAATPALDEAPIVFDYAEYKITAEVVAALTKPLRIKNVTMRYTIQPRTRLRWQLSLPLHGAGDRFDQAEFTDGTPETRSANYLRKIIYNAYRNKLPILFYDIDFSKLTAAVANLESDTITIAGTDLFENGDFLAIKTANGFTNRKIKDVTVDTGDDSTSFKFTKTGLRRVIGAANDTAAAIDAEVRRSHAAYVTKITNERVIIDPNTVNNTGGYSNFSSDIVIELVEV